VKPLRVCRTALLAMGPYLVLACGGSPVAPPEPPVRVPDEPSSESSSEARPVFANCRLGSFRFASAGHDESVSGAARSAGSNEPNCAINADCIAQQGVTTHGDGAVAMECARGDCACRLESRTPPNTVVEFRFAATCSTPEVMERLIREHCLAGMDVKPASQGTE
jgi:hypothetical protein